MFPLRTMLSFMLLIYSLTPSKCEPVCGYENGSNSTYVCVCDTYAQCHSDTIQCPTDGTCRVECIYVDACYGATIEWPLSPGSGTILCDGGRSACAGVNFPIPSPDEDFSFDCNQQTDCASATIYCPLDSHCHITCSAMKACRDTTIHWSPNHVQSTLSCTYGSDECLRTTLPPSDSPTLYPTTLPTTVTFGPTQPPTSNPTSITSHPTFNPTQPTLTPTTLSPTTPTLQPTLSPFPSPTSVTVTPSAHPTTLPTIPPSIVPSVSPSKYPTPAPICGYVDAPINSEYVCLCHGLKACRAENIVCPSNSTCSVDCSGTSSCYGANIQWPVSPGAGTLTCHGRSSCYSVNFPIPLPYEDASIVCDYEAECANADIYCPEYANCSVTCMGHRACLDTIIHWSSNNVQSVLNCVSGDNVCLRTNLPPTLSPTLLPTHIPTHTTYHPTLSPTHNPTELSLDPTNSPAGYPTSYPTAHPTQSTATPTIGPLGTPSKYPTSHPSMLPTTSPTTNPSKPHTLYPTNAPTTSYPTTPPTQPTAAPTKPSSHPTSQPSEHPTYNPSKHPTSSPTHIPTTNPTSNPTEPPTIRSAGQAMNPIVVIGILSTVIVVLCVCGGLVCGTIMIKNKHLVIMVRNNADEATDVSPDALRKDTDASPGALRKDTVATDNGIVSSPGAAPEDNIPGAVVNIFNVNPFNDMNVEELDALAEGEQGSMHRGYSHCSEGVLMTGADYKTPFKINTSDVPPAIQMTDVSTPRGIALMDIESYAIPNAQKDTFEVQEWLQNVVELSQYFDVFIANGYESMHLIQDIPDENELKEIGIVSKQHQVMIMSAIEAWKSAQYVKEHKSPR